MALLLHQQKNSKKQGDVGMAIAISWLTQAGYLVSIPLTDSNDYDLIIDSGDHLSKVQVKTTYRQVVEGTYELNLRVLGGNRSGTGKIKHFDPDIVDYLFAVTESGDKYFIPSNEIESRSTIRLGCEKYDKYKVE